MHFWPHIPVWPTFMLGSIVLARFNWPAALVFGCYWYLFQVFKMILPTQEAYFLFISVLAGVSYLAMERSAGIILSTVALIYAGNIFGQLPNVPKMIIADIIIAGGMVICGYLGPHGGILVGSPRNNSGSLDLGRNAKISRLGVEHVQA